MGQETGEITGWILNEKIWLKVFTMPTFLSHVSSVKRIKFNLSNEDDNFQVATCGSDHSVRIFTLKL